jgi:predicted dehydrogenase
MESPLHIGLIGVGKHGTRYARHIHEDFPEIELIGLWRRNADDGERQAPQYGCRYFQTYSDLLSNKSIDAVVVALPPWPGWIRETLPGEALVGPNDSNM